MGSMKDMMMGHNEKSPEAQLERNLRVKGNATKYMEPSHSHTYKHACI